MAVPCSKEKPVTTFNDLAKSHVRAVVQAAAGFLVAFGVRHNVHLDATETVVLTAVITYGYWAVVRLLERYVTPKFGWLLGLAQQPVYQAQQGDATQLAQLAQVGHVGVALISEIAKDGARLGRHVEHDIRSLAFRVNTDVPIKTVQWRRHGGPFNQGNLGSCHDEETEILTSRGWLPFPDLTTDHLVATVDPATRELNYERPVRVIRLPYDGDVYAVSNRRHDFRVTPDHTMLVRRWDERARTLRPEFDFVAMRDVGWYAGLMETVVFKGITEHDGNYTIPGVAGYKRASQRQDLVVPLRAWLRFLGIYLAEGTVLSHSYHGGYKIQLAATKRREKTFIRTVLADLGIRAVELPDRFTFQSGRIWRHLEALGLKGIYASEKFVPDFVFDLPADDIKALLEGHREGDGSQQYGSWTHHTISPRLADDLQRLIFLAGGKVGVSVRAPRTARMRDGRSVVGAYAEYGVRHLESTRSCIERKKDVRVEHLRGIVYCAEVPTHHTLVTRRNGRILIAGNCTGNAVAGVLNTEPFHKPGRKLLRETDAVKIYTVATQLDAIPGAYPPTDTGSSGLAAMKAAKQLGLIGGYNHALGLKEALAALMAGPAAFGTVWLTGMDTPDARGIIQAVGDVRGGHEYEALGVDAVLKLIWFEQSWGPTYGLRGRFAISWADVDRLLRQHGDVVQPALS
jgi:hypothetical protein